MMTAGGGAGAFVVVAGEAVVGGAVLVVGGAAAIGVPCWPPLAGNETATGQRDGREDDTERGCYEACTHQRPFQGVRCPSNDHTGNVAS